MAKNGHVLSVSGGGTRGERKEAVKKRDAKWPAPDPELSRADGKTCNEPWTLRRRECTGFCGEPRTHLRWLHSEPLSPCQAEPYPAETVVCYCYCYYWKKYFHSSEGQLRLMTHLHRRSTQIACAKITIWYNNLHHKTPHFLLPRVSKFQAWGKILASFPKYLCRKNNVAYTEGGREREIMR